MSLVLIRWTMKKRWPLLCLVSSFLCFSDQLRNISCGRINYYWLDRTKTHFENWNLIWDQFRPDCAKSSFPWMTLHVCSVNAGLSVTHLFSLPPTRRVQNQARASISYNPQLLSYNILISWLQSCGYDDIRRGCNFKYKKEISYIEDADSLFFTDWNPVLRQRSGQYINRYVGHDQCWESYPKKLSLWGINRAHAYRLDAHTCLQKRHEMVLKIVWNGPSGTSEKFWSFYLFINVFICRTNKS